MVDETGNDELSLNIEEPSKVSGGGSDGGLKEKFSLKMIIITGSVLAVIIIGIVLFFVLSGSGGDEIMEESDSMQEEISQPVQEILFDDIVELDVVEIRLGDMGGEKNFKVGLSFKIDQQELRDEFFRKDAQIHATIVAVLKNKTFVELEGVDGKILLKHEIIKHVNEMLDTGRVVNLFFHKYLII